MKAHKTVYVLIDNTQHEPNVVGVYLSKTGALNAWTQYYLDQPGYGVERTIDDDEYEQFDIQLAPMASK